MMEFWPENQGKTHLYSKFGTVPGRNCTHIYHDRHQATHYPVYYGEQQDQGRESSYWTVPGSRTGGALHDYTNWTDQELTVPASPHFPFILDRQHAQHHQDLGGYQSHEARDREWTAAHRAARDYERGFLREGWQRRWEPVHHNREVCAKRSDSSYRELEAWAARYSHSLPRRRRIEAELRGASRGLVDSRSGTDPQVAALQHVRQSANIREPVLWDKGGKQQAPIYYPTQAAAPDTSHMLDVKENTSYQRRTFSQPPGYIAPPPYNSPHKCSPVMFHCDSSWDQDGKRQTYWSQPTLRKQDVSVELRNKGKGEKEEFTKPDESMTCPELDGLKQRRQEADAHIQREHVSSSLHPQAAQSSQIITKTSSKVIEGRKFRLNKKTGGMTIFCLVSRIAGTTEPPSLPLRTFQTNIQSTEIEEVPESPRDRCDFNQVQKLADEVDFTAPTRTQLSDASDVKNLTAKQEERPACTEKELLGDNIPNKAEANTNVGSTFGRQTGESVQPVSVKYPLWREPSFTSWAETESSSTCCLQVHSEEEESHGAQHRNDCANLSSHPIDIEVRRLDIEEDNKRLLVIDTTCIVVKMELISSPKKEHVHYLGSTAHVEDSPPDFQSAVSPELNCQSTEDVTTEQNADATPLQMDESPETHLDAILLEKEEHMGEDVISSPCMPSSPASVRETLEERAERILGIPLHDCVTEQQPKAVTSLFDLCFEEQDEETEPSPIKNDIHDVIKQTPGDTAEEEQSQSHSEVVKTEDVVCLRDSYDTRDQVTNVDGEDFARSQEQISAIPEVDSQFETDIKTSTEIKMTDDPLLEHTGERGTSEQDQDRNQAVEDDQPSQPSDLYNSSLSPPDLTSHAHISESNTEEGPDPEVAALNPAANLTSHPETSSISQTPLYQLPSSLPTRSIESSSSSTAHTDRSPSPPPPPPPPPALDLIDQTAEATSSAEDHHEKDENEITSESLTTDLKSYEVTSQQQLECGQPDDAAEVPASALEQNLKKSKEKATGVDILQQQLECVQTEGVACVTQMAEEQPTKEVSEGPTGLSVQSFETDEENTSDSQIEVKVFQQQFDCGQEMAALYVKDSCMTEDQSQKNLDEHPAGLWEQKIFQNNATDSQTQLEIDILQDIKPSQSSPPPASDCEVSRSPFEEHSLPELSPHPSQESYTEFASLLDIHSICPSPLNPDAAAAAAAADTPERAPPPHQFSSSSLSGSPPVLPPSSTPPPPQEEHLSTSYDIPPCAAHKEEPQYPRFLRDVVNRIRKHTAPDSENEEDEVSELWGPENAGEDLGFSGLVMHKNTEKMVFDEVEKREGEMGHIQQDHRQPSGNADEDTVSCSSSNSSHGSGDTVIVADEDEVEEMTLDVVRESKTGKENEELNTAEAEVRCSDEVKEGCEENKEEERDEADPNKSCQSEECPVEVENGTTRAAEMMETNAL